jgi:hypothetical protein
MKRNGNEIIFNLLEQKLNGGIESFPIAELPDRILGIRELSQKLYEQAPLSVPQYLGAVLFNRARDLDELADKLVYEHMEAALAYENDDNLTPMGVAAAFEDFLVRNDDEYGPRAA